ncbi:unnamed protein product [Closterium sp. NIES-54]
MATITVVTAAKGGQQQPLPHPHTLSPQQLREWAAALGASESAAPLGASESAAAPGASESAAALGARASPALGPTLAEALHT